MRFASTLLIQTIITSLDFKLYQINIQIAFLNGELNKKIYIDQLPCFMTTKYKGKVNNYKGPFITYNNNLNNGILHKWVYDGLRTLLHVC